METRSLTSKLTLQKETIIKLRTDSFVARTRTRGNVTNGNQLLNFKMDIPTILSADACTTTISGFN